MSTNPHSPDSDKKKRVFQGPVAWLLGRQLLASLKGTLLYTAFGSKLDARDWMHAEEYPANNQDEAEQQWQRQLNAVSDVATARDFWRGEQKEFWFDYIADTGDSMRATYSIAYLCLSDLLLEASTTPSDVPHLSAYYPSLKFIAHPDAPTAKSDEYPNADLNRTEAKGQEVRLPRGQFLMVGGDTTYHLSDYEGLHVRFQTPFSWAFDDIRKDGRLWKEDVKEWDDLRRPLFGIPGNHDYYDQLDGFRRQFHRPVKRDAEPLKGRPFDAPQLMIPGFVRHQSASYVALRLPFDWLLWALDTEVGKIDERQRNFFCAIKVEGDKSIKDKGKPPKLIVATCAPTTVFGKYPDKDDEKSAKAFFQLSLPRPFLDPDTTTEEDGPTDLEAGQCRLDISGDVHHYARYWGADSGHRPRQGNPEPKHIPYYASVVSGLGGAFHHPSTTYAREVSEQVLYPSVTESRREVARKIFDLWNIIWGGGVWAIGFMLAFLLFFAATIGKSSSQAVTNFLPLVATGISDWTIIKPTVATPANRLDSLDQVIPVRRHWPLTIFSAQNYNLGLSTKSKALPKGPDGQEPCVGSYAHFWGKCYVSHPPEYWWGTVLAALSLGILLLAIILTERIYEVYRKQEEVRMEAAPSENDEKPVAKSDRRFRQFISRLFAAAMTIRSTLRGNFTETEMGTKEDYLKLMMQFSIIAWSCVILSILTLWISILIFDPLRDFLTPYGNSMLVIVTLAWAAMAAFLALRYSDWLSRMASKITIKLRYWALVWVLSIAAVLGIIFGFALFGQNNTASDLVTDVLLMSVSLLVFVGLTFLGIYKVNEMKKGWKWGSIGGALGVFHALIQLFIPYLIVRKGNWLAWAIWLVLMIAMPFVGRWFMRNNWAWLLAGAWLFFGTLMLLLPYIGFSILKRMWVFSPGFLNEFRKEQGAVIPLLLQIVQGLGIQAGDLERPSGWVFLAACFIAGAIGFLMACMWLSWYLAVALLLNGHNNEAGGAARIEKFKQFIRFRLTERDLTGFVIAVDEPKEHGTQLRPKLIDVIYLKPKQGAKAKASGTHAGP
jgi:hypothetical protein